MSTSIATEEAAAVKQSAAIAAPLRAELEQIQLHLERLVDMRLDGELDTAAYNKRKARLLSRKKSIEENLVGIDHGRQVWLEPLKNWIYTAQNMGTTVETGSLSELKTIARRIFGSNLLLAGKKARGEAVKPWAFLADNELSHDPVPPRGIEPLLQDPQSCVLSVERRGRRHTISRPMTRTCGAFPISRAWRARLPHGT